MLTLYHDNGSYNSQKVRLYLFENNILWNGIHFDLLKQEHLTKDYLQINPQGLIPALIDDGNIILNSTDIMKYLEANYAKHKPENEELAKAIYLFSKQDEGLHDPFIRTLSFYYLWMNKDKSPEEVKRILEVAKRHPNKSRGVFLEKAVLGKFTMEEIHLAKSKILERLKEIEKLLELSTSSFIFGDNYSIADAVVTAFVCRIKRLDFSKIIAQYPLLSNYYVRMQKRESFLGAKVS